MINIVSATRIRGLLDGLYTFAIEGGGILQFGYDSGNAFKVRFSEILPVHAYHAEPVRLEYGSPSSGDFYFSYEVYADGRKAAGILECPVWELLQVEVSRIKLDTGEVKHVMGWVSLTEEWQSSEISEGNSKGPSRDVAIKEEMEHVVVRRSSGKIKISSWRKGAALTQELVVEKVQVDYEIYIGS